MADCFIIGGGIAGLSAGVYLSKSGIKVHLLEASPKLGGRAYSFFHSPQNDTIDNGQHIMMGCYHNTLDFIKVIDAANNLFSQEKISVNFVERGGRYFLLSAKSKIYPFNIINAFLRFDAISFKSRLSILKIFAGIFFNRPEELNSISVSEWLKSKGQKKETIKRFWEILTVGTLNTSPEKASADTFLKILKEIFLKRNKNSRIIIPDTDLSDLYCLKSKEIIESSGGAVLLSESVEDISVYNNKIIKIRTKTSEFENFEYVISAVPYESLVRIIKNGQILPDKKFEFEYSPIVNIHLWLSSNPFNQRFYGLIDSKIHWLFIHKKHVTLTTSYANDFVNLDNEKILEIVLSELEIYFPVFHRDLILDHKIIKEKRATFVPGVKTEMIRKGIESPYDNLFLAGDWTNTELPSTIESAVKSGKTAADKICLLMKGK